MKRAVGVAVMYALIGACGGGDPEGGEQDPTLEDGGSPSEGDAAVGDAGTDAARPTRDAGDEADSGPFVPPPDCGNATREGDEACDDGNNVDGDGCTWECHKETGFNCSQATGGCASICGDGLLVVGEECDDANLDANDGCSDTCRTEPGWVCLGSGASGCSAAACGDGIVAAGELCDDHNTLPGDGCSLTCAVESGWLCAVQGESCTAARCGDGVRAGVEKCDDGETSGAPKSGDGCTAACDAVEANYTCPAGGGKCTRTSICGNGLLTSDEACDDHNTASGDGCSATCQKEAGWQCTSAGQACTATRCGDGIIAGSEQCEDNNSATGDGCAACKVETGWACSAGNGGLSSCHRTSCGDATREGEEACDDGNDVVGDGCSPTCKTEPTCQPGMPCQSSCGDGIRLPSDTSEECDDGNLKNGDGCSSQCKKEQGFVCTDVRSELPSTFPLTVVYRDFISMQLTANGSDGHPDFNAAAFSGDDASLGMVQDTLVGGKPVYTGRCQTAAANCGGAGQTKQQTTSKANFDTWYADPPSTRAKKLVTSMVMGRVGSTSNYQNPTFNSSLFPLDGKGWVAGTGTTPKEVNGTASDNTTHNFGFTTEIHHWFEFKGGEKLTFSGDDDVWVFIGGKLALDLGGLHPKKSRTITLNVNGTVTCSDGLNCGSVANLGITVGNVYEMALFHAERHTNQSNFDLTLNGFNAPISVCASVCGDGVVTTGEVCDDGSVCAAGSNAGKACTADAGCPSSTCVSQNTGSYGHCKAACDGFGPHCGDGTKQINEACDLGSVGNDGAYNGCTAACKLGPKCGDGKVDGSFGEQCDLPTGNVGGYGGCASSCKLSERCGDAVLQSSAGEQCDDGMNRGTYGGCAPGCVLGPRCGDGVVQTVRGEQCDDGVANDGHYGGCMSSCKNASRCGDRVVDEANGEQCDDGNRNDYDGCSSICQNERVI